MIMNNNTNKTINNLAAKNIKADRKKRNLLIVTIALSICLVTTILLSAQNIMKSKSDEMSLLNQGVIFGVSDDIAHQLQDNKAVKKVGVGASFNFIQCNGYQVYITYYDTTMLRMNTDIKGTYPKKQNEIIVCDSFLNRLNIKKHVGDTISLNLTDTKQTYTICGIYYNPNESTKVYPIFVSKPFYENWNGEKELNAYVWLNDPKSLTEDEATKTFEEIANTVQNDGWRLSDYYNRLESNITVSNMVVYIGIAIVLLITASLVVYSIFYISIEEKVKEYGQLRTIGATRKQIYRLVMKEGFHVGTKGIAIGYLLGILFAFIFYRKSWSIQAVVITTICVLVFGYLLVLLSIHKPSKIASSITPIEALHGKGLLPVAKTKETINVITPTYIARANLLKNRKKTILSIISMSLCGLCFILISCFQSTYNPAVSVKNWNMRYGSFQVGIDLEELGIEADDIIRILNNQYFTSDFINAIKQIDGVTGIKGWSCCPIEFSSKEHNIKDISMLMGYTESDIELLQQTLTSGELSDSNVVLSDPERFRRIYHWKPQVGDSITLSFSNINGEIIEKDFTIGALSTSSDGFNGYFFRLPKYQLDKLTSRDSTYSLEIKCDKKYKKEIQKRLRQFIVNTTDLKLTTIDELIKQTQTTGNMLFYLGIGFACFLGIFAIINEMNLVITNIRSRFYEIGILQSIGMTRKQLRQSLLIEGICMNGISIIITLLLGIPGGFIISRTLINMGCSDKFQIPFLAIILYIIVNICLEVILMFISISNLKKITIVERLRENAR